MRVVAGGRKVFAGQTFRASVRQPPAASEPHEGGGRVEAAARSS
jgi:hypothetical protein